MPHCLTSDNKHAIKLYNAFNGCCIQHTTQVPLAGKFAKGGYFLGGPFNPRNTRPFSVLENEYRVLVSEYRKPKNGRNGVPFPKNSVDPQTETRGLWVVWGAEVHPKKP